VFGCGGDRDPSKRPLMGAIAARDADRVWITSDNPRGEPPEVIAEEILAGVEAQSTNVTIELDRGAAIHAAVRTAERTDIVVVAGKGHETKQDLGNPCIPFSDVDVARAAWEAQGQSGRA
jgi:UDP-N-acetylmuramyl tripeptide synthase